MVSYPKASKAYEATIRNMTDEELIAEVRHSSFLDIPIMELANRLETANSIIAKAEEELGEY